ncbi:hypothetical protein [Vibrio aestuarianus]|uniref:Uncharacterized protein n=1 Tax=Vibrio aestuarianus TaxID=28171 RepID=A0A9X4IV29_9VIBR|nr:hypothetical protein [Vibrio aestuarianus]MDE1244199.1 hypothetical protein [Vibrio aestuarianus]
MKYEDWVRNVYEKGNEALVGCFNNRHLDAWSEDQITTRLLEKLESLGRDLSWEGMKHRAKWEGYKLKGKLETKNGDIAFIVRIWLTQDKYVDGVAFYEAKRQFYNDSLNPKGFISVKKEQLNRLALSKCTSMLLYDVDYHEKRAYISDVPIEFVRELADETFIKTSGRYLHHLGRFWAQSLGDNLLGRNLNFDSNAVKAVRDSFNTAHSPLVIVNSAVSLNPNIEPKLNTDILRSAPAHEHWLSDIPVEQNKKVEPPSRDDDFGPSM